MGDISVLILLISFQLKLTFHSVNLQKRVFNLPDVTSIGPDQLINLMQIVIQKFRQTESLKL